MLMHSPAQALFEPDQYVGKTYQWQHRFYLVALRLSCASVATAALQSKSITKCQPFVDHRKNIHQRLNQLRFLKPYITLELIHSIMEMLLIQ
ncbi:hypothetical protein JB92DRAFT_2855389 [Gautieria morchelliformis]|nr:hypothetical protein JB92DRAFT_2855389 [Gautieria morchelliformis]